MEDMNSNGSTTLRTERDKLRALDLIPSAADLPAIESQRVQRLRRRSAAKQSKRIAAKAARRTTTQIDMQLRQHGLYSSVRPACRQLALKCW